MIHELRSLHLLHIVEAVFWHELEYLPLELADWLFIGVTADQSSKMYSKVYIAILSAKTKLTASKLIGWRFAV